MPKPTSATILAFKRPSRCLSTHGQGSLGDPLPQDERECADGPPSTARWNVRTALVLMVLIALLGGSLVAFARVLARAQVPRTPVTSIRTP